MNKESELDKGTSFVIDTNKGTFNPFSGAIVENKEEPAKTVETSNNDIFGIGIEEKEEKQTQETTVEVDTENNKTTEGASVSSEKTNELVTTSEKSDPSSTDTSSAEITTKADDDDEVATTDDEPNINAFYYLAKDLQAKGTLAEDLEITDDITGEEVLQHYESRIQSVAEERITNKVLQELRASGVNEQDIQYAQLIRSGVDPNTLSEAYVYEKYSKVDISEENGEGMKEVIRAMYKEKDVKDGQINTLIETAELDEELGTLAEEAKNYFKAKNDTLIAQQQTLAEQQQEYQKQIIQQQYQIVDNALKSGKLLDQDIPDVNDFKKSLYEKTKVVEYQGQKYPLTEFEEFQLSYQNNPEVQLWAFSQFKFRENAEKLLKDKVKKEVETDFMKGYKQAVESTTDSKNKRQIKKELDKAAGGTGPIFASYK